jgi:hypothetical protein
MLAGELRRCASHKVDVWADGSQLAVNKLADILPRRSFGAFQQSV